MQMHIYGVLMILEILLLVSVLAVVLYARNRSNHRQIRSLEGRLRRERARAEAAPDPGGSQPERATVPEQSYADFLKDELDNSSTLLGSGDDDAGQGEGEDAETERVRSMLAARHQFLQLELDAQAMDKDPQDKRRHLVEKMEGLLVTLSSLQPAQAETAEEAPEEAYSDTSVVDLEKQHAGQIAHLRQVIDNQHQVMRELRELLEKEMGDSEHLRDMVMKLEDAETQSMELSRSLEFMEKEGAADRGGAGKGGYDSVPDADMLRDLVGNQQQTITRLQGMLKENIVDDSATTELRDAIEKVQRSNQELGTCVMVLEDENTMLRDQIESLRSQLEGEDGGETDEPVTSQELSDEIDALPDAGAPADTADDTDPAADAGAADEPGTDAVETAAQAEEPAVPGPDTSPAEAEAGDETAPADETGMTGADIDADGADESLDAVPPPAGAPDDSDAVEPQAQSQDAHGVEAETAADDEQDDRTALQEPPAAAGGGLDEAGVEAQQDPDPDEAPPEAGAEPETGQEATAAAQDQDQDQGQESPDKEPQDQESPDQESPEQESPEQESPEQESPEQESPEQESPEQESPEQESPEQESPEQESPEQEREGEVAEQTGAVTVPAADEEQVEDIDALLEEAGASATDTAASEGQDSQPEELQADRHDSDTSGDAGEADKINTLQDVGLGEGDEDLSDDEIEALLNGTGDRKNDA